jgi:hypothetical protein
MKKKLDQPDLYNHCPTIKNTIDIPGTIFLKSFVDHVYYFLFLHSKIRLNRNTIMTKFVDVFRILPVHYFNLGWT